MPNAQRYGFVDIPVDLLAQPPGTAFTTVAATLGVGATSFTPASGSRFPTVVQFDVVVGVKNSNGSYANGEVLHVTDATSIPWTVVRTNAALVHAIGESVYPPLMTEGLVNNPGGRSETGDMDYLNASGRLARIAPGADRAVLIYNGGIPGTRLLQAADIPDLSATYATPAYVGAQGFVTPSSVATFTNKGGNISQWTNDAGYLTGVSGADTRVLFFDGANTPAGDAGFIYNKTTKMLTTGAISIPVADVADRQGLVVTKTPTAVDDFVLLNEFRYTYSPSADSANSYVEVIHAVAQTSAGNSQSVGTLIAIEGEAYAIGTGTVSSLYGNYGIVGGLSGTPTVTAAYGYSSIVGGVTGSVLTSGYNYYADSPSGFGGAATITDFYQFYGKTIGGQATNAYSFWSDEQGVFRIKADNTFNSVYQAIAALYNPQFTKYTVGAVNYERIVLAQWNGNVGEIGTESGGTGTLRLLRLIGSSVDLPATSTMNSVLIATQTYVNAQGFVTASSSTAFTNKTGNISQWTNDAGYLTSGGTIGGTIAAGQVGYGTALNTLGSEAAFAYDAGTNTLSVDTLSFPFDLPIGKAPIRVFGGTSTYGASSLDFDNATDDYIGLQFNQYTDVVGVAGFGISGISSGGVYLTNYRDAGVDESSSLGLEEIIRIRTKQETIDLDSGDIDILTGDVTGTGDSGNIRLHAGTVAAGLRGYVSIQGKEVLSVVDTFVNSFTFINQGVFIEERNAIGTTSTDGIVLRNMTAAAAGAQQYSPRLHFSGFGWGTTAGTSQAVDGVLGMRSKQDTVPVPQLTYSESVNGGAYTPKFSMGSAVATVSKFNLFNSTTGSTNDDGLLLSEDGLDAYVWNYEAGPMYFGTSGILRWHITSAGVLTAANAMNIAVGTTTGTKIGTATSQKIGFFNATPVVQRSDPGALTDSTTGTPGSTLNDVGVVFSQAAINNNFASVLAKINSLRTILRDMGIAA